MNSRRPCIFGEVLFDHFPDGSRVLGGAPFNVAWHLQAFGQAPRFISRVGSDAEGEQIREAMRDWGMSDECLQRDPALPTGRVTVTLHDNEPSYDIVRPAAYDAIDRAALCDSCDLLYHGSLALRDATSRQALQRLIEGGPGQVFVDVNLRPPWWQLDAVLALLAHADWLKINGDELLQVEPGEGSIDERVARLFARFDLDVVVVTRGAAGATLYQRDGSRSSAAPAGGVEVVDTVGAGDAFAAVLLLGLIHAWPAATTLERAQSFASRIVANRGAVMTDFAAYQAFADAWKLAN